MLKHKYVFLLKHIWLVTQPLCILRRCNNKKFVSLAIIQFTGPELAIRLLALIFLKLNDKLALYFEFYRLYIVLVSS